MKKSCIAAAVLLCAGVLLGKIGEPENPLPAAPQFTAPAPAGSDFLFSLRDAEDLRICAETIRSALSELFSVRAEPESRVILRGAYKGIVPD